MLIAVASILQAKAQLISGPWAGNCELRNVVIWAEVAKGTKTVAVSYAPETNPAARKTVTASPPFNKDFNPLKIELNGLEPGTRYTYKLLVNGVEQKLPFKTSFSTKELWQYRKPAPDFSFLAGSCAYINEAVYDRPGNPYGQDTSIFSAMAKTSANFNIWMGDNWYTREVDYATVWGLQYRASHDRSLKILQPFMASMPQYSIWDDHDYGPNDAGKEYIFKKESREVFKSYALNPTFGQQEEGIYTSFGYSDADFFLTDNRFFRAQPQIKDSLNGQANPDKTFFGPRQMEGLKNQLLYSKATFKFIVVGSQVLNPLNKYECMTQYPTERTELLNFIKEYKIDGVVFLTGDRHHSEVIKLDNGGGYPLYDITVSPLTAGISTARGIEKNSEYRVPGTLVETQNFGQFSISGPKGNRKLSLELKDKAGTTVGSFTISEKELKNNNKTDQ